MVRSPAAADESLAAMRARIKLGIAIAAMIRMIATTISSSISEKPLALSLLTRSLRMSILPQAICFCRLAGRNIKMYLIRHSEGQTGQRREDPLFLGVTRAQPATAAPEPHQ